ncbi:ATP-binding cassette sub-family G member 1-like isoform X2 [Aricia agestis]|uniref:ATP-binding cassette sub-family G member 1-like isoform X2 n=1 Tax=Aricia agestis TaxID=91739 RepID=UPI001C207CB5|nr:ATP-binding cassette sub-family G member 1-like isoform X2 [Aricia agestis]
MLKNNKENTTDEREILHKVSGEFRSGELACIIGPSGAGKSTLLNILSGYITQNICGKITINGQARNMKIFKKLSCYIQQDDVLQQWLTVSESMKVAADLKLGQELGSTEKELIVEEILQTLGLYDHRDTMTQSLSGGQLKRLAIALELVNNPPVVFLDEPTTGLDVVSVRQMAVLLRLLSRQGRTIVCTIHQPSATLFSLFDRVYILAQGLCCYQGTSSMLLPFLTEARYICPKTHNPADFVLETLSSVPEARRQLSELCHNGKIHKYQEPTMMPYKKSSKIHSDAIQIFPGTEKDPLLKMEYPTTFLFQFYILIKRMVTQSKRESLKLWLQLLHHSLGALVVGSIFFGLGNDAKSPMVNIKFCLCCQVFFMFTYAMIPILLFPTEVEVLKREYFNHWYSFKAYYAARTLNTVPTTLFFTTLFTTVAYFMAGQPTDWVRFVLFTTCGFLTAICSESIGLLIGALCNERNGAILGPSAVAPLLALACYGFGFGEHIEPLMRYLMNTSFVRYSLSGQCLALFHNRAPLSCSGDICIYSDPKIFLRDLGMIEDIYWQQALAVILFIFLFRIMGFLALKFKLFAGFNSETMVYISKLVKRRNTK